MKIKSLIFCICFIIINIFVVGGYIGITLMGYPINIISQVFVLVGYSITSIGLILSLIRINKAMSRTF